MLSEKYFERVKILEMITDVRNLDYVDSYLCPHAESSRQEYRIFFTILQVSLLARKDTSG